VSAPHTLYDGNRAWHTENEGELTVAARPRPAPQPVGTTIPSS
jgi:hypothetical protein